MIAARQSAHKTDDAGMMNAWSNAYGLALGAILAGSAAPSVAAPDEFYAGRTITVITSGGGAYEAYGRALSRHMPKYISGHPTMIVQAMPGAGGARAASYLYKAAAATAHSSAASMVRCSPRRFSIRAPPTSM
jgi:tripartite-type tricarboxylate transporter receptor subunit TctC